MGKINSYLRHDTTTGLQLPEIDAFRGAAALWVLIFHCTLRHPGFIDDIGNSGIAVKISLLTMGAGRAGLDLFFFISGFLLFISFGKAAMEGRGAPSLFSFYKRRFKRIAPAYYASLIIIAFLSYSAIIDPVRLPQQFIKQFLVHILFLHNLSLEGVNSFNPVYWTLAIEMQYYIILPFIASWFHGKKRVLALLAFVAASALYKIIMIKFAQDHGASVVLRTPPFDLLIWRLDEFAFGMFFAGVWLETGREGWIKTAFSKKWAGNILSFASLILVIAVAINHQTLVDIYGLTTTYVVYPVIMSLLFGGLILGTITSNSWYKNIIANPLIQFFGIISYSLYIWHDVVIGELCRRFPALNAPGVAGLMLTFAIVIVLTTAVSIVSYLLFERPFLKKTRKSAAPAPVYASGA